ncbi:MAG TPA: divalent-cation tolerance protein CutA [Sphingomicrobium sp.]|nr:divalent-cation tolerance protein CutA [Sphingomicrobium sp.]
MTTVSVYAVFADAEEAERIGRIVVGERLAACINIFSPCRSIYRWQERIETAREVPAILKTNSAQADRLIDRIAALHSYDLPCIAVWPVEKLLAGYGEWVEDVVGPKS